MTYAQYSLIVHTIDLAIQDKVRLMTMLQTTPAERLVYATEVSELASALIEFSNEFTHHKKEA